MSTPFPVALSGARAETLMWAHEHDVDHAALNQLRNISALPWVEGVRVMPDVHLGKGATVGSVIAMRDAVSPNAVGVDIGCGMIGVRTSLTARDLPDDLARLRSRIEAAIPVGFNAHDEPVDLRRLRPVAGSGGRERLRGEQRFWDRFASLHPKVRQLEARARKQLGTLGGGNHFVELCLDQDDRVWLQLHSGSRNIGKTLAEQHVGIAKHLDHNRGLVDRELAVFLAGTPEMDAYLNDLWWAQDYAARSRAVMMALAVRAVREEFAELDADGGLRFDEGVNVHHNYVAREQVDGAELIVTRKGAIRAGQGDLGLIPGSMGTGSYVVRGLGNPRSYWSASHGAGRRMSRSRAKKEFTLDDLAEQTAGVECRKDHGVLDEIPGAYKDLDAVIEAQSDLVEVVARLRTILCVKG
ncbi:RtcB family protein [Myceligenerans xiligouense]|uniref:3'-phosphate/5'-hydroxy nucleic acid ligase n=1 Tax=Myceligenerans xiligouense TaxID=253184 RepID=A0A3N4YMX7_9MICO|nr:RtcB family protein [Myceligenerans xiligouense]RPF20684.1 tRNA-splicing ligase RtcB [Myceligenerans xiligouense]